MLPYLEVKEKFPCRHHLPHDIPTWLSSGSLYFITVGCRPRGLNQLCHPQTASVIFESARYRQDAGTWFARLLLLMPDHLHALIAFPPQQSMTTVVQQWKGRLARQTAVRWQRGFFEHRLRDPDSWEEKAHYIRQNPVRADLIKEYENWPYFLELA